MSNQPPQQFCTNCGQPLPPGTAFCVNCGASVGTPPMGAPNRSAAGPAPGYPPPYAQAPKQGEDDPLLDALAAGYIANRMGRNPRLRGGRRPRRPGSRLRGCGCILLFLVLLAGPVVGLLLTTGRLHMVFIYILVGMAILCFLLVLAAMLFTQAGREALAEGMAEGCVEAILGGLFGGG